MKSVKGGERDLAGVKFSFSSSYYSMDINDNFWKQTIITGQDCQVVTMIHEISHFSLFTKSAGYTLGTGDHVDLLKLVNLGQNGIESSQYLARTYPPIAIQHADNFAYYVTKRIKFNQ